MRSGFGIQVGCQRRDNRIKDRYGGDTEFGTPLLQLLTQFVIGHCEQNDAGLAFDFRYDAIELLLRFEPERRYARWVYSRHSMP